MKASVRLFARLRKAVTTLQDLFDDTAMDPLSEHPVRILTNKDRDALQSYRDKLGEDQRDTRVSFSILLRSVDRLGDRAEEAHETLSLAIDKYGKEDAYAAIYQAMRILAGDERYRPRRSRQKLVDWLRSTWDRDSPFTNNPIWFVREPTVIQVIAALHAMKGVGRAVGDFAEGGPLGRLGLTREEEDMLIRLDGMVEGWLQAEGGDYGYVAWLIGQEVRDLSVRRITAKHDQAKSTDSKPVVGSIFVGGEQVATVTDIKIEDT